MRASLSFFSNGQYRNPLVVRIAGYGYQKGFGGHFHNENAVASLRAPIFEDKVVDHIFEGATVTEKEVSKEELEKAVEALDEE